MTTLGPPPDRGPTPGNPAQAQNNSGVLGGCYGTAPFRQVFSGFFFAPSGTV